MFNPPSLREDDPENIEGDPDQLMGSGAKRGNSKVAGRRQNDAVCLKRSSGYANRNTQQPKPSPPKHSPNSTIGHPRGFSPTEHKMVNRAENSPAPYVNAASELERYCRLHSLPAPKFNVLAQKNSFLCTVHFKENKYHSYPDLSATELQARDRAAFKALEKLGVNVKQVRQPATDQKPGRPQSMMETPEQVESVVSKLLKMLEKKPTGIFRHAVGVLFAEDYNAELPEDWIRRIQGHPRLEVRNNGGVDVLYKKTADLPYSTQKSGKIRELAFPPGGAEIFVTNVINANHFCALMDRNRRKEMESEMNSFYSQENVANKLRLQESEDPVLGTFYATHAVGWCRVQCVEKQNGSEAAKYRLIDCGAIQAIPKNRIYHLANTFYSYPLFLTNFCLQDIADIDESEANDPAIMAEIEGLILLKQVWAVPAIGCDPSARPLPVRMFSKSGSASERETSNEQLSSNIDVNSRIYRLLVTPAISSATGCSEAYLSNVSPDGTFFLQIVGFGLREFHRLNIEPSDDLCVEKVQFDEVYCALLGERWSRCVATRIASNEEIGIEFIDYGVEETVPIEKIFPLNSSGPIKDLPPQALRTHMTNVLPYKRWSDADIAEITQACPPGQKLIVEFSGDVHCRRRFCDLTIQHVNIFKPTQPSGNLVSMNREVYKKLRKLA